MLLGVLGGITRVNHHHPGVFTLGNLLGADRAATLVHKLQIARALIHQFVLVFSPDLRAGSVQGERGANKFFMNWKE